MPDVRIDKTAFSVISLDKADDELQYWLTKTPKERLRALELVRQTFYGYDPATSRLQRVLEVARRAPHNRQLRSQTI